MKLLTLAALGLAAILAVPAHAEMGKTAEEFAKKTAVSNLFEIKSSELALQKAETPEIREFAQSMIDDHGKATAEFKAVLPKSSVKTAPPEVLDEAHQVVYDKLAAAEGEAFESAYVMAQANAHKEAVSLFSAYASNGDDAVLKGFAAKTLPVLEAHQKHVGHLKASLPNRPGE